MNETIETSMYCVKEEYCVNYCGKVEGNPNEGNKGNE